MTKGLGVGEIREGLALRSPATVPITDLILYVSRLKMIASGCHIRYPLCFLGAGAPLPSQDGRALGYIP